MAPRTYILLGLAFLLLLAVTLGGTAIYMWSTKPVVAIGSAATALWTLLLFNSLRCHLRGWDAVERMK